MFWVSTECADERSQESVSRQAKAQPGPKLEQTRTKRLNLADTGSLAMALDGLVWRGMLNLASALTMAYVEETESMQGLREPRKTVPNCLPRGEAAGGSPAMIAMIRLLVWRYGVYHLVKPLGFALFNNVSPTP